MILNGAFSSLYLLMVTLNRIHNYLSEIFKISINIQIDYKRHINYDKDHYFKLFLCLCVWRIYTIVLYIQMYLKLTIFIQNPIDEINRCKTRRIKHTNFG